MRSTVHSSFTLVVLPPAAAGVPPLYIRRRGVPVVSLTWGTFAAEGTLTRPSVRLPCGGRRSTTLDADAAQRLQGEEAGGGVLIAVAGDDGGQHRLLDGGGGRHR